jgi:hypothetical protein
VFVEAFDNGTPVIFELLSVDGGETDWIHIDRRSGVVSVTSASGYTVTTTDARFEVRNGRLALSPNQVVTSSQVGTVLTVPVMVVDRGDFNSTATLNVDVLVQTARGRIPSTH